MVHWRALRACMHANVCFLAIGPYKRDYRAWPAISRVVYYLGIGVIQYHIFVWCIFEFLANNLYIRTVKNCFVRVQ